MDAILEADASIPPIPPPHCLKYKNVVSMPSCANLRRSDKLLLTEFTDPATIKMVNSGIITCTVGVAELPTELGFCCFL